MARHCTRLSDGLLVDDRGAAAHRDGAAAFRSAAAAGRFHPVRCGGQLLFPHLVPGAGGRVHGARDRADRIAPAACARHRRACRSEEHTSELQSLMRISYAVFCLKKKTKYDIVNAITPRSV